MDLEEIFESNSDCYADTRKECNDTIPPILIEGEVVMAMTKEAFIETVKNLTLASVNNCNHENYKRTGLLTDKKKCLDCGEYFG